MARYISCHSITKLQLNYRPVIKKRDISSSVITEKDNHIAGGITLSNSLSPISRCLVCSVQLHSMWLISFSTNMSHNTHGVNMSHTCQTFETEKR